MIRHTIPLLATCLLAPVQAAECVGDRELLFLRDQVLMAADGPETYTDIYTIRSDGSGERRLTNGFAAEPRHDNVDAAWSSDGRQVVFVSNRDGDENPEIYRMAADGSGVKRLTMEEGYDEYPDWSSRGEILFSSNREGADFQLFAMDADGRRQQRLTATEDKDFDARWSPDGRAYLFTRERNGYRVMLGRIGAAEPQALTPAWFSGSEATWTPDGSQLVFVSDGHAPGSGHLELYRMDTQDNNRDGLGDNLQRITNTAAGTENMEPDVSRDGHCLLFVRGSLEKPDHSAIHVMPMSGGEPVRIAEGFAPRWR